MMRMRGLDLGVGPGQVRLPAVGPPPLTPGGRVGLRLRTYLDVQMLHVVDEWL